MGGVSSWGGGSEVAGGTAHVRHRSCMDARCPNTTFLVICIVASVYTYVHTSGSIMSFTLMFLSVAMYSIVRNPLLTVVAI